MSKAETIHPLGFNVLVEIVEHANKTKGGILLPTNSEKEIRSELVRIISCGKSAFTDCFGDQNIPPSDNPYALIQRNAGQPFEHIASDGEKKFHRLVQSDHILGVMNAAGAIKYCQDNFNFKLNIKENA